VFLTLQGWRSPAFSATVRHIVLGVLLLMPRLAAANPVTIGWDPNPESNLLGYTVHITTSGVTQRVDVGTALVYTHEATPGVTYYFSVSAYGANGATSARSAEIAAMVPLPLTAPVPVSPSSVTTAPSPTFTWRPVSGATRYQLEVRDWAQQLQIAGEYSAVQAACGATSCSIAASIALPAGSANWRMRAMDATSAGPWSVTVPFTVGSTPASTAPGTIPQGGWRLQFVSSQELTGENGAATNAFDGNPSTIWHTAYRPTTVQPPHTIDIDLGSAYAVSGFRYLPRQDGGTNGRIASYEFYVSTDGVTWGSRVAAGTLANLAQQQEVRFATKNGRFIRLRALSAVNGAAFASMAELNVLGTALVTATPKPLSPAGFTLRAVSSEETAAEWRPARHVFDGNAGTFWHSRWSVNPAPAPHDLQINLGATYTIAGIRYLPRQDGSTNGRVATYEVYVSSDGSTWGSPVSTGTLRNVATAQDITFPAAVSGRYIRFRALSEVSGRTFASMAELTVLGIVP
jgi:hypothetical protein